MSSCTEIISPLHRISIITITVLIESRYFKQNKIYTGSKNKGKTNKISTLIVKHLMHMLALIKSSVGLYTECIPFSRHTGGIRLVVK